MIQSLNCLQENPYQNPQELWNHLKHLQNQNNFKTVVLDDDPTGVQTIHDLSVFTTWDVETLCIGMNEVTPGFFILTNSRALTESETTVLHKEIIQNLHEASKITGKNYLVISRGDSTLRGHFPLETQLLKEGYERNEKTKVDGEIICPFFLEGGRFTIDNIHYVKQGNELISANCTEFAKDTTFGYESLSLPEYVEEKSHGEIKAEDVITISLQELRSLDYKGITDKLLHANNFAKIILNATNETDLIVACICIEQAIQQGKHFMFRTAASFVKIFLGIESKPLLSKEELIKHNNTNGGLIVIGSHTDKTTKQMNQLKTVSNLNWIELNVDALFDQDTCSTEMHRCLEMIEQSISSHTSICMYTSRSVRISKSNAKEENLKLSTHISSCLCQIVNQIQSKPSYVIAKGGITSSDVATIGLHVKHATVAGQIQPGIPVWLLDESSKFPGIPYIIFPGNVGEEDTLLKVVNTLK